MKDINKSLNKWLKDMEKYNMINYENLPDIDLYMEQMTNVLDHFLNPFNISSLDKTVTPAMVNNYVKGEVITAPKLKKYSREQIAQIIEVWFLKKALSINSIKEVIDANYGAKKNQEYFNGFVADLNTTLHNNAKQAEKMLKDIETNDINGLENLAVKLSIDASFKMMISERIFEYIKIQNDLKDVK